MDPKKIPQKHPTKLEEGVDFTIEHGKYVFTKEYLKKRGYCCENGCRNCPYGFKKPYSVKPG